MAKIEPSVLKGQCLDRRIADMATMQTKVAAWEKDRNNSTKKIDWQFTTSDARIKLRRLYPKLYMLHGTSSDPTLSLFGLDRDFPYQLAVSRPRPSLVLEPMIYPIQPIVKLGTLHKQPKASRDFSSGTPKHPLTTPKVALHSKISQKNPGSSTAPRTTVKKKSSRPQTGWSRRWRDNVSRGLRQKENVDGLIPCVIEPDENTKPNRNWARLIQKIAACPGHDPGKSIP